MLKLMIPDRFALVATFMLPLASMIELCALVARAAVMIALESAKPEMVVPSISKSTLLKLYCFI